MGVNGIYGLSGSGLDVESMVKVGMLGKQAEYDKMQQKYTKDEWKKTELLSLYGEVQTFNASTLSKYKMSSNMNSRDAESADSSTVTATANANAATMTHYVEVTGLASSAYLIGTTSPERLNTDASEKTNLASVLFSSIEAVSGNPNEVKVNGTVENADKVAFSFSMNDGVNGIMTGGDTDVVIASATADTATGTYKVKINSLATTATSTGAAFSSDSVSHLFATDAGTINDPTDSNKTYSVNSLIEANKNSSSTALSFVFNDGDTNCTVDLSYQDLNKSATDFIDTLNQKLSTTTLVASYDESKGITITNNNGKVGTDSTWSVKNSYIDSTSIIPAEGVPASSLSTLSSSDYFVKKLFVGDSTDATVSDSTYTFKGKAADVTVTDENGTALSVTPKVDYIKDSDGKIIGHVESATTTNGISMTLKGVTDDSGFELTNDGAPNVSVTYRELLDGFSFYDLTSKINSMGLNIRANYDSVQDRFSFYNKKSGEKNAVNIQIGKGDGTQNAVNFFNQLGLKQSSHGNVGSEVIQFAGINSAISQTGINASAKIDGIEYENLEANNVSVDGVTYNFQNLTEVGKNVAVTVTQDTETILKNVQSFVDDYNALLTKLYKWYDEKPNSDYKPLTETQKSAMKEEQIEKWEEKAKAGMLYHDKTLGKVITELRAAVSENVDGVNGKYKNVFSIGISTTGLKGQLTLDKDKLKAALAEDPDAVYNVFAKLDSGEKQYQLEKVNSDGSGTGKYIWSATPTQEGYTSVLGDDGKAVTKTVERNSYNGIAQRLGDAFMASLKNIKKVSGTTASITEDSEMNNLMRELQTKMSNFKRMMQAFETRLYKKYDAMESSLALLGSQLNYVTSAFQ